jgi:hypothetical protein
MRTILVASALAFLACSSESGSGSNGTPAPPSDGDAATQPATVPPAYPQGPYGGDVGQTVTNFSFQGLTAPGFDVSSLREVKLGDFYDPKGTAGRKLVVVSLCSVWCPLCPAEYTWMPDKVPEYTTKGVAFIGVLFENADIKPIDIDEASAFATKKRAPFDVAIDPQYQMSVFTRPVEVPVYVVLSARDMKVLNVIKIAGGSPHDGTPLLAFLDQKLAEIQ